MTAGDGVKVRAAVDIPLHGSNPRTPQVYSSLPTPSVETIWRAAAQRCGARCSELGVTLSDPNSPSVVVIEASDWLDPRIGDRRDARFAMAALVVVTRDDAEQAYWRRLAWDTAPANADVYAAVETLRLALDESARRIADRQAIEDYRRRVLSLNENERLVFDQVCSGRLNKQIAREVGVSVRTIEQRRRQVFTKMGVDSAVPLAALRAQVETLEDQARRQRRGDRVLASTAPHGRGWAPVSHAVPIVALPS
ncbi:LuxR C-terminal-related transcriptional regulator [Botrimarina sp.]|uniref:LuxR C-terminal-related transcriptional regulator n=1 Tax=Botrimarina sp. TaxID=2795802 RepID=UPI0032ED72D9